MTVKTLTICTRRRACKRCRRVCKRRLWPLLLLRPLHPLPWMHGANPAPPAPKQNKPLPLVLLAVVVRIQIKDSLLRTTPALVYLVINAYLCFAGF